MMTVSMKEDALQGIRRPLRQAMVADALELSRKPSRLALIRGMLLERKILYQIENEEMIRDHKER
eukprot:3316288-Ditylum_brightwellii.AAC.1